MRPLVVAIAFSLRKQTGNTGAEQVVSNAANPIQRCLSTYPNILSYDLALLVNHCQTNK